MNLLFLEHNRNFSIQVQLQITLLPSFSPILVTQISTTNQSSQADPLAWLGKFADNNDSG